MSILFDRHYYEDEADIPDLGSMVNTSKIDDFNRTYKGLAADFSKLPTRAEYSQYTDLQTGDMAIGVDTGDYMMYEKITDRWYPGG